MKVIIAGSRQVTRFYTCDGELVTDIISRVLSEIEVTEIVSGGANGADFVGETYARENEIPLKVFEAKWNKFKNSAGYIRNKAMAEYGDVLIAFSLNNSKGTEHMINLAAKNHLIMHVFDVQFN